MNKDKKDKVIKDLKERNDKIDMQRFQHEVRYLSNLNKIKRLEEELDQVRLHDMELEARIDKAIECIENKLSYETYQHLKKIYDDIDGIEEIWEDYEFDDLLDILRGDE